MRTIVIDELSGYFWQLVKEKKLTHQIFIEKEHEIQAECLILKTVTRVDSHLLAKYPKLRLIIRAGTGFDNIDLSSTSEKGIVVCNTPEANAVAAYEHTLCLLFALLKNLKSAEQNLKQKSWRNNLPLNTEVSDLKALVVGVGRIGSRVAEAIKFFGGSVMGVDPYLSADEWLKRGIEQIDYQEGVRWCNLISYHCPLTPETENYFSENTLSDLTQPIFLINTARGGIVNEVVLLQGLKEKKILGAGLDVFENEPDFRSELLDVDNLYLTPHTGAHSDSARKRMASEIISVWESFFLHRRVINQVSEQRKS